MTSHPVTIAGVHVMPLKLVRNDRGRLMEIQRHDDAIFPGFGQVYVTATSPGIVKAWYRHHRQTDQIAPVTGSWTLALFDTRAGSPTCGVLQVVALDERQPMLVQIPPGVWHGFQNVGPHEGFLLHLNSIAFNFTDTDEDRLDPHDESIPYSWAAAE